MSRIGLRYNTPTTLVEQSHYDLDIPHYLYWRDFKSAYYSPLHYAESLEIVLFRNAKGTVTIGGHSFPYDGRHVFVIPSNIVHDVFVEKCSGMMYVFHSNFNFLDSYLNVRNIMNYAGTNIHQLDYICPAYDEIWTQFEGLIEHDGDIFARMQHVLSIFSIISRYKSNYATRELHELHINNNSLQQMVDWTNENFQHKISLEDASDVMHLSKHYFCKWFKKQTHMTYTNYLNTVRISHACELLKSGIPIAGTCLACGIESPSYFIQLFKKYQGCTPGEYAQLFSPISHNKQPQ